MRQNDNLHPDRLPRLSQILQYLQTVQHWHPDVEKKQVRPAGSNLGHGLAAIGSLPHAMAGPAQPLGIERPQGVIIFGHDDGGFHVASSSDASQLPGQGYEPAGPRGSSNPDRQLSLTRSLASWPWHRRTW